MSLKTTYYIAIFVGSTVGSYIPQLWGARLISFPSIVFSTIGALVGFIIVWKWLGN